MIPIIRAQKQPKVHLIVHAAPTTKNMRHFNDLSYIVFPHLPKDHKIPSWLSLELGIFSGRLYFQFPEYALLMRYLAGGELPTLMEIRRERLSRISTGETTERIQFATNPLAFLTEWLTLRRKEHDIMNTPMGYICQKRILDSKHSFFFARNVEADNMATASFTNVVEEEEEMESEDEREDERDSDIEEWNVVDDRETS